MQLDCIQTGLKILAAQRNDVAVSMLDELQKKQGQTQKDLEACYLKEKMAVKTALIRCKLSEQNLNKVLPLNNCIVDHLGSLGLKGNLLAQMLLLQTLRTQNQMNHYKDWQEKFDKVIKNTKCE